MKTLTRCLTALALAASALLGSGCTTTIVLLHVYDKVTEGDPTPCRKLNTVQRALDTRCGTFVAGSIDAKDLVAPGLPVCPLALAARDPKLWPVLPELEAKGAMPEHCATAPLVELARANPCPDFAAASADTLAALRWLGEADARAVQHDALRLLSCPGAVAVGLDRVLDGWQAQGALKPGVLAFSPLAALHPSRLASPLGLRLEAQGHTAAASFGAYEGTLPHGFDEALRLGDLRAIAWWLDRQPGLANRVPATQADQLDWLPLARVVSPAFIADEPRRLAVAELLLARGADPWRTLPYDRGQTVVTLARQLRSPLAETLARATVTVPPRSTYADAAVRPAAAAAAAAAAAMPRR